MPQPIDVGSILGGRYKVTGRILASAENDVILDGLDQVLNRPVSILVSAVENSQYLMQSAREVATGTRVSKVSILDLGTQDHATYLIASRTSPAELLDLVVPTEPTEPTEQVYQEPFFTDTLGTEIFGKARDAAPVSSPYIYEDNTPLTPGEPQPAVARRSPPAASPVVSPATAAVPAKEANPAAAVVPPVAAQTATTPKVTLWEEEDYGSDHQDHLEETARRPGTFPAELRGDDPADAYVDDELIGEEDDDNAPRTGGRWLTWAVIGVLLVGALIFAVQHIGTLFDEGDNQAAATTTTSAEAPPANVEPTPVVPAEPAPVTPVIAGLTDITAYAPGVQNYGQAYFPRLKDAFDGNKATYWPTVEYSNADFAGLNTGINLVVELAEESNISSVTINQLTGSGGQFNILTNSTPGLDGAVKIGSGSFSAPDFTFTAPPGIKAKYVIISFTELPKLQPFVTYPYGLKITEISVK